MTAAALLREGTARLRAAGIGGAARDAHLLLAEALGIGADRLPLELSAPVTDGPARAFEALIARRSGHEPVSRLLGRRAFFDHDFVVGSDTLDPRPETEVLVRLALEGPVARCLDLGTGTGAILLSILAARPAAAGIGTDVTDGALAVAAENAQRLGVAERCSLVCADWFEGVAGRFDLIVSNPPYIAAGEIAGLEPEVRDWDPRVALTDGADGLTAYRAIAAGAGAHLAPGGRLLVEIGPSQGAAVTCLFETVGLDAVTVHADLDGRDRVVSAFADGEPGP